MYITGPLTCRNGRIVASFYPRNLKVHGTRACLLPSGTTRSKHCANLPSSSSFRTALRPIQQTSPPWLLWGRTRPRMQQSDGPMKFLLRFLVEILSAIEYLVVRYHKGKRCGHCDVGQRHNGHWSERCDWDGSRWIWNKCVLTVTGNFYHFRFTAQFLFWQENWYLFIFFWFFQKEIMMENGILHLQWKKKQEKSVTQCVSSGPIGGQTQEMKRTRERAQHLERS